MARATTSQKTTPVSYIERLLIELGDIHTGYTEILGLSGIANIDPSRDARNSGIVFVGSPTWGWTKSDPPLETARMALLRRVRSWAPRYRLLFPHPTPTVSDRLDKHIDHLERWLVRPRDGSIPPTVPQAIETVNATVADLRALAEYLPDDEYAVRLTVDTNTLIDNPDLTAHVGALGQKYMAHLLPVVLGEIDDLKRAGRTQDLRDAARRADRRLKGLRTNGDVLTGVRVAHEVFVVFEHVEPASDRVPSWLDLTVPDDRFVASSLLLQSDHPGSVLYTATSDINLQNKLAAVGLPFVELP